jgi:cellulose synthase (UDP-forming)
MWPIVWSLSSRKWASLGRTSRRVDIPASSALVAVRYALVLLSCITGLVYFQWRSGVFNPLFPAYAWIVYGAEVLGFARTMIFLFSAVRLPHRDTPLAPEGLTVDVFVTTYNEPAGIVGRTLMAAIAIQYPHRTWLLDDGERPGMQQLARDLGCGYIARTEHANAKAGNLNHALAQTDGAFIAVFDADHVADPRFLDRTLGYFSDERLAYVQTPHEFFNVGSFEHLAPKRTTSNASSLFHSIVQRSRDASDATMFTGSSAVLRRQAIDDISGFATGTINEDIHSSLRLHAAGWKSRFHAEILSAGLAPLDAAAFCGQRLRWAQDAVQLLLRENVFAQPAYLLHVASNLEGWRHLFIYALPIVILVTGILPVQTDAATFLAYFVPYFLATTVACAELSRGHIRFGASAVYNLARCPASIIAAFTAHREQRFHVTPKTRSPQRWLPETIFTCVLLLVTLGAVAYACGLVVFGRSPLAGSTVAVVVAWAAFHAITAARLLVLEHRCARDRRATTRFDENLVATLTRLDDSRVQYVVEVTAASADGLTLRNAHGAPPALAGEYRCELDVAGAHFSCAFSLRESGLGGSLTYDGEATRGAFDLLLHHRARARFAAADRGDRGGVLHPAGINRRRYPKPRPSRG